MTTENERRFRVDVVDEETGQVVQSVGGIPERHIIRVTRLLTGLSSLVQDMKIMRDAFRRTMEPR
jgi:hypothetical protein